MSRITEMLSSSGNNKQYYGTPFDKMQQQMLDEEAEKNPLFDKSKHRVISFQCESCRNKLCNHCDNIEYDIVPKPNVKWR